MKKPTDFEVIYHELSGKYGQIMSSRQVCQELGVSSVRYARRMIPNGWIGSGKGLAVKTVVFARQLAEL